MTRLRKKRVDLGALTLASPRSQVRDRQGDEQPSDVGMYVTRETNKVVEEMMLLANETVATRIFERGFSRSAPQAPRPDQDDVRALLKAASPRNPDGCHHLEAPSGLSTGPDEHGRRTYLNTLIRLATRCMTQAEHFSSGEVARSSLTTPAMPITRTHLSHQGPTSWSTDALRLHWAGTPRRSCARARW